jgi:hypothetical protein
MNSILSRRKFVQTGGLFFPALFNILIPKANPLILLTPQVSSGSTPTVVSDNFNRADGALGANWTVQLGSNMAIVSNEVKTTTLSTDQFAVWNGAGTFAANQYAKIKVTANVNAAIVAVRSSGSAGTTTCYWARKDGIHRFINGPAGYASVQAGDITINLNDILELRVTGTTLQRYVNGVAAGPSGTDSNIASGKPGFGQYTTGSASQCDDLEGGSL